jgi:hypothetical protein
MIDVRLNSGRGVCEAEWPDLIFELAVTRSDCPFVFIALHDSYEVIRPALMQLHKYPDLAHPVKHRKNS